MNGFAIAATLQIVRYSTSPAERLTQIIRDREAEGALIAHPHPYILDISQKGYQKQAFRPAPKRVIGDAY